MPIGQELRDLPCSPSSTLIRGRYAPWFQRRFSFALIFRRTAVPLGNWRCDYAKAFGARLLILHVIDFPGYVDWAEKLHEILEATERSANERLQLMAKECAHLVKDVKTYCRTGITPKVIIVLAQEESVDLIVVRDPRANRREAPCHG